MHLAARPFASCSVQARRGAAVHAHAPLTRRACRRRVVTQARRQQEHGVDPNATAGSPDAPQESRRAAMLCILCTHQIAPVSAYAVRHPVTLLAENVKSCCSTPEGPLLVKLRSCGCPR